MALPQASNNSLTPGNEDAPGTHFFPLKDVLTKQGTSVLMYILGSL